MSTDVVQRPGPAAPRSPESHRLTLEGLQESRPARAIIGALVAAAVLAIIYVIVLAFTGHFTNVVRIDAQLPAESNAVPIGAPVEYRNVTVGKVASEAAGSVGGVAVKLDIYPSKLAVVPKGVAAQVAPLSIFGNQYVNLVAPPTITASHLEAGQAIPAYTGTPSTSLQGTVTQLYTLLNAIHPADLDTALTAFATALNGQGLSLGQALRAASNFMGAVAPRLATVQADLRLTQPVSAEIQKATPAVLGTLSNSTITGQTINSQAAQIRTLLTSGSQAAGQLAGVLTAVESSFPTLINESGPLLSDVARNPNGLSLTLQGLTQFSLAVSAAESHGPFLSVSAPLVVSNISAGINAALGYNNPSSVSQALGAAVNPSTYSSGNCPQYPGETNPYCGVGGSPDAQPVQSSSMGVASPLSAASVNSAGTATAASANPYAQEQQAIDSIATAVGGGKAPQSPAVASVLLMSLLASMSSGS